MDCCKINRSNSPNSIKSEKVLYTRGAAGGWGRRKGAGSRAEGTTCRAGGAEKISLSLSLLLALYRGRESLIRLLACPWGTVSPNRSIKSQSSGHLVPPPALRLFFLPVASLKRCMCHYRASEMCCVLSKVTR